MDGIGHRCAGSALHRGPDHCAGDIGRRIRDGIRDRPELWNIENGRHNLARLALGVCDSL